MHLDEYITLQDAFCSMVSAIDLKCFPNAHVLKGLVLCMMLFWEEVDTFRDGA
jgi:hypothetical protein